LLGPALLLYGAFGLAPLILLLVGTVYEFGFYGRGFLGFEAFQSVFNSPLFWRSLWNSLKFVSVLLPLALLGILTISITITWTRGRAQKFIRAAYYIPAVSSAMMIALVWRWVAKQGGPLNTLLGTTTNYLAEGPFPFIVIVLATLPTAFGGAVVILSAALASIDSELYEAARMDGCTPLQEALYITIPSISPVLLYIGVTSFVALIQLWQYPYGITGGGPNYKTTTLLLLIYQKGFTEGNVPQATVMSLFLIVLVLMVIFLYKLLTKQRIFT
jgi:multiple sugar transport system permease protein